MAKTFFKYLKKKWWTFLIYAPVIFLGVPFSLLIGFLFGGSDDGSPPLVSSPWLLGIICYFSFVIVMSLPMMIITVPASRELGRERGTTHKKYFWAYQGIILGAMTILLIVPYHYLANSL
jgi:hypothetical protein